MEFQYQLQEMIVQFRDSNLYNSLQICFYSLGEAWRQATKMPKQAAAASRRSRVSARKARKAAESARRAARAGSVLTWRRKLLHTREKQYMTFACRDPKKHQKKVTHGGKRCLLGSNSLGYLSNRIIQNVIEVLYGP